MRVVVFEIYFVKVKIFVCLLPPTQGKIRVIEVSFFLISEISWIACRRVFFKFRISF